MPDFAMPIHSQPGRERGGGVLGSVAVSITKTIRVAAGVFAPGHLGELTQHVPLGWCSTG